MTDFETRFTVQLDRLADSDAPSQDSVLTAVRIGYARRLGRRRRLAIGSAAAVVLLVAGATALIGPGVAARQEIALAPLTVGPRVTPRIELPAGSQLVRQTTPAVVLPVTVPSSWVSFAADGPVVSNGPGFVTANWAGASPTARETIDVQSGTTGTGHYRGYLVTNSAPSLSVYAPGFNTTASSSAITVNGHPARLLNAPKGSYESTYITPAEQRITWQLEDKRWIQVWAVGEDVSVLTGFASAITDEPDTQQADLAVSVTVKGFTSLSSDSSSYVSQLAGPSLTLCRPGTSNDDAYRTCMYLYATVEDVGFYDAIANGSVPEAQVKASTRTVTVAGVPVSVNPGLQTAWTRWGPATIVVHGPAAVTLSTADLADLAASVTLAPSTVVKDQPNLLLQSSLAAASAQQSAGTTSG